MVLGLASTEEEREEEQEIICQVLQYHLVERYQVLSHKDCPNPVPSISIEGCVSNSSTATVFQAEVFKYPAYLFI